MAKRKKSTPKEQRWLLISDEAAIHYPRRIDYYATLTERERDWGILHLGVGYWPANNVVEFPRERWWTIHKSEARHWEKVTEGRSSRSGSLRYFKRSASHFPRFPWASKRKYIHEIISRLPVTTWKNSALHPRILSFYPSHSCLLFPRLIDIRARPCVGRTQWDTVR